MCAADMELAGRLDAYTRELDSTVESIRDSGFPCSDAEIIYAEVSSRLKDIIRDVRESEIIA